MNAENVQLPQDFIQLARTALAGRPQDIQLLIHRASKKYSEAFPQMTDALLALLKESPSRSSPLRKQMDTPLPVDLDSRLQLLRVEIGVPDYTPILSIENETLLNQVVSERQNSGALFKLGLHPTKSMLFTGPPGVGKTLAAKWIASRLNRPLLVLDLAAVMSSFLGRTGNNIRYVLDYAKSMECVLLLDELDAIAKRRDDNSEIGELKRLVTVLLQEIDDWPSTGLLLAATNHPDLLDPAVWRRFEAVLKFSIPPRIQIESQIRRLLNGQIEDTDLWSKILSFVLLGQSFSEVERQIMLLRKTSAIGKQSLVDSIQLLINSNSILTHDQKVELACSLEENGIVSQRRAYEITGISRDTIRKHRNEHSAQLATKMSKVSPAVIKKKTVKKAASKSKKKNLKHGKA